MGPQPATYAGRSALGRGFQGGFREGLFNGAKGLVEGAWGLVKGVVWAGYNGNPIGSGLDQLRQLGVDVPDWAPSAERVDARMQAVGQGVATYLSEVDRNPGKLGDDVKGWIAANWNGLKADYAKAAAQGPAAEAHWWGQVTGRATFEVAAVAVPVTKFATVARAGEALEVALRAGKLGETLADAARAGKLGELFAAATKAGKLPELVSEARTAGRLPELVAEARKTTGGLEALASKGGLTPSEVESLGMRSTATPALRPPTMDAVVGRLGGGIYGPTKIKALEAYLARRGITLQVGDQFLPSRMAGGFDATRQLLILRDNPTNYEVWHELSHTFSSGVSDLMRTWRRLGRQRSSSCSTRLRMPPSAGTLSRLSSANTRWNTSIA